MLIIFSFNDKWKSWIGACVFAGNLFVLVIDTLTKEIKIQMRLKQEDPLAHFLVLLVVEGLNGLIKRSTKLSLFSRLKLAPLIRRLPIFSMSMIP